VKLDGNCCVDIHSNNQHHNKVIDRVTQEIRSQLDGLEGNLAAVVRTVKLQLTDKI